MQEFKEHFSIQVSPMPRAANVRAKTESHFTNLNDMLIGGKSIRGKRARAYTTCPASIHTAGMPFTALTHLKSFTPPPLVSHCSVDGYPPGRIITQLRVKVHHGRLNDTE